MVNTTIALDRAGARKRYQAVTGGQYVLRGRGSADHTGHKDVKIREGRSPGSHLLASRCDDMWLLVCADSNTYVHDRIDGKIGPGKLHCLKRSGCSRRLLFSLASVHTA